MVQYIYFVKCPECEDEHFDFFDEAKEFAMGCITKKPIITQIEVNRNDFGECTDSCDLGTVWSWEEVMKDIPAESTNSFFTKDDLKKYAPDCDPEFTALDNSLDVVSDDCDLTTTCHKKLTEDSVNKFVIVGEKEDYSRLYYNVDSEEWVVNSADATLFDDRNSAIDLLHGLDKKDFYTTRIMIKSVPVDENTPSSLDNFKKSIPADMTIEALVEEMEENEDTVECKWCDELFDKSECRYEVDLGYLCPRCEAAIKSRGETLTFREGPLDESYNPKDKVEFNYDDLEITIYGPQRDVDDWDEIDYTGDFTYVKTKDDVAVDIWENFITEEDAIDVPGGLDALEDNDVWEDFLKKHFDTLLKKYYNKLLDYYRDAATEAFQDGYSYDDYQDDLYWQQVDREYEAERDRKYFDEDVNSLNSEEGSDEALDWHTYKITYSTNANPASENTIMFKTWVSDVEYAWRKSPQNIPHTTIKNIELVETLNEIHDLGNEYDGGYPAEYDLSFVVSQAINHLVNDLGEDHTADDFTDRVVKEVEDNYDITVPAEPNQYAEWCTEIACEVSRQLNNAKSFLEAFDQDYTEDSAVSQLSFCDKCDTDGLDLETGICINCGAVHNI